MIRHAFTSGGRLGLRFDPMGGGQFKKAVETIIEAESQPIRQLEARKSIDETKLKLFQEFKSKFAGFENALGEISSFRKFREFKVDLGDGKDQIAVTVDKDKASPGTYQLEVKELAARTSVITNGHADPDEKSLGIGFLVMDLPDGESLELFVGEDQASLRGIARLVNSEAKSPVRAAVIRDESNDDAPWKLIFSAKKEGAAESVSFPQLYFLDGQSDLYVDDDRSAQNATLVVDGFEIEAKANQIEDFLPGVNLQLKQAKEGVPFTIQITEDYEKVAGKMKNVVDQMNVVLKFINDQNKIDESTDTRTTFAGDTSLQGIEYRLRNLMHEGFRTVNPRTGEERYIFMNELGIEFDKTGSITFKEEKFTKYIQSDFDGIADAISGEFGFSAQLREVIGQYTRPGTGLLASREQGLRGRISNIDRQIEQKTRILERRQQALTEQFSRLQGALSNMQNQQAYLSSTLGGGGGNPISQLLGG